jgi:protein gp37
MWLRDDVARVSQVPAPRKLDQSHLASRRRPYEYGFDLRLVPQKLSEPLRWKTSRMVFVNSMSDLFHEDVPDDYVSP